MSSRCPSLLGRRSLLHCSVMYADSSTFDSCLLCNVLKRCTFCSISSSLPWRRQGAFHLQPQQLSPPPDFPGKRGSSLVLDLRFPCPNWSPLLSSDFCSNLYCYVTILRLVKSELVWDSCKGRLKVHYQG